LKLGQLFVYYLCAFISVKMKYDCVFVRLKLLL